jgi:hypothetical protein
MSCTYPIAYPIIVIMPNPLPPNDDELAAALVAVDYVLHAMPPVGSTDATSSAAGWHEAARLTTQNVRPRRLRHRPTWGTVERVRRSVEGGLFGVTGL